MASGRDWQAEIDRWTERFRHEARPPRVFADALRDGWSDAQRDALAAGAQRHAADQEGFLEQLRAGGCTLVRVDMADEDCSVCEKLGGRVFAIDDDHPELPPYPVMPLCPACRHRVNLLTPYFLSSLGLTVDDLAGDTSLTQDLD